MLADDTESFKPISDRVKKSLKPVDDGFYQLGYRDALSDVVYIVSIAVLMVLTMKFVIREFHEPN